MDGFFHGQLVRMRLCLSPGVVKVFQHEGAS
jgi:hypothetical protein